MSTIVNLALSSTLPPWLYNIFAYSKLIGLVKQNEENINGNLKLRPIGIGMVWPKIISKTILNHYIAHAKEILEPFQFGLSKGGLESITFITKEALKEHPNWVLLRLDLVNAFNSILRKIIFEEVSANFPLLLPWLHCLYGRFSDLWTKSEDGTCYFPLSSEEGVKQGCTLGSFLFCIAIQNPIIKKINSILNNTSSGSPTAGFAFALLDDINIIADPSSITEDFWTQINSTLTECGLSINMKKATLYTSTCTSDSLSTLRSKLPLSLKFHADGVELVGAPIGNEEFCQNYWELNLINEIRIAIPIICSWPDVQRALCLFRLCIISKYNYFLRHTDPRMSYANKILKTIHDLVRNGLARILDPLTTEEYQNVTNDKIWSQATLPPKLGGLGIQDPLLTHLPAYIAAASIGTFSYLHLKKTINVDREQLMESRIISPEDSHRPTMAEIQSTLSNNGTEKLFNIFKEKYDIKDISISDLVSQSRLQTFLASYMYSSINSEYRKHLTRQDLDRINSCCYEGAVLITALPCHEDFCISGDHIFRERLQMRLGLPIPGITPGKCLCKHGNNDVYGYHLLSVCNKGNQRINTHNAVRDSFREMCIAAGLTCRIEDMETLKLNDIDTKSRVDVICDNFIPGLPMAFDQSIADPRQTGLSAKPIPGKAAKKREYSKIEKFKNDLARQGTRFEPFVIESFGRWGYKTRIIFKNLVSKIKNNSKLYACSLDENIITHHWRCKITMAMHRQACLGMHCRILALQRHHHLKANLPKVTLSEKVVQKHPFENNTTILDESNGFASSTESMTASSTTYSDPETPSPAHDQSIKLVDELLDQFTEETLTCQDALNPENSTSTQLSYPVISPTTATHNNNHYSALHLFTDGSCKMINDRLNRIASWGVAIYLEQVNNNNTTTGNNNNTITTLIAELFGPVVTDSKSPFFLGATSHSNNTGELTSIGEAVQWLIANWRRYYSYTTRLKNIVIHSDSIYAISATIGTESGPCNLQLYSNIRLLLTELKNSLHSSKLDEKAMPFAIPTLSIRKVKSHAGIEGNEHADTLAQKGQKEVCHAGRYAIPSTKISAVEYLHNLSKNSSPGNNLEILDANFLTLHETPGKIGQFPHCNSPHLQQSLNSDRSSLSTSSRNSSPAIHPFDLSDY